MTDRLDIEGVEAAAYRSRFDDGLIDSFFGWSLLWVGACWLWLPDFAGLAGVLPAVLVAPFVAARTRFLEGRAGHVRFSPRRRSWERNRLAAMAGMGVVAFLAGVAMFLLVDGGGVTDLVDTFAPGLVAGIVALMALVLGVMTGLRRFAGYGIVLAAGAVGAAVLDTNPGAPLLVGGVVVAGCGLLLVLRFVRSHPTEPAS